jgi:hypothetical protein
MLFDDQTVEFGYWLIHSLESVALLCGQKPVHGLRSSPKRFDRLLRRMLGLSQKMCAAREPPGAPLKVPRPAVTTFCSPALPARTNDARQNDCLRSSSCSPSIKHCRPPRSARSKTALRDSCPWVGPQNPPISPSIVFSPPCDSSCGAPSARDASDHLRCRPHRRRVRFPPW